MDSRPPDRPTAPQREPSELLVALGFSPIEALVYTALLAGAPRTGYQIAHAIGKPVANTYKAINSLEQKGAVLVASGEKRLCRAVPYQKLLDGLERDFRDNRLRAEQALAALPPQTSNEGVYDLRTVEQVVDRFRLMLEQAEERVVIDAFPLAIDMVAGEVRLCAERGVDVTVKVYRPVEIPGANVVVDFLDAAIMARWPGQWLNLVVDSNQHLLAFLETDCRRVHQAVWSDSPYLSMIYHCGIVAETALDQTVARLKAGADPDEILSFLAGFRGLGFYDSPGRRDLLGRYSSAKNDHHHRRKGAQ